MRNLLILLFVIITSIYSQEKDIKVYKSSLYFGASVNYPRYMTVTDKTIASHANYGFSGHIGWNATEHFGFRLTPTYLLLSSFWYGQGGTEQNNFVNMGSLNLEAIYKILPCELISPFVLLGYGTTYFKSSNPYLGVNGNRIWMKDAYTGYQALMGLGAEFKFWDQITIKSEFKYITASNNKIDGNDSKNENKGILSSNGDSYMNLSFGAYWFFWTGEESTICDPQIITNEVIREVPIEVEKTIIDTVYIDKVIERAIIKRESFVLQSVRFKFDQDILTSESELILENVAKILNKYPNEKIEIFGHTDSWGSDAYNLDLSNRRAARVKTFLVKNGVDSLRLFTAGCGERNPIADNGTSEGRALNRRIEFSIYNGVSGKCSEPIQNENIEIIDTPNENKK